MKYWKASIILLCLYFNGWSSPSDTTVFSFDEYLTVVEKHHPLVQQARLLKEQADANLMLARGSLDPKIGGDLNRKSFDEKNYYTKISGGLKIPTWFGAEINAGYARNTGQFLNGSDFLPPRGIWELGISIPLLKGIVIDARRAEIKKAKIFIESNEQERRILLNSLFYEATVAYLDWQTKYQLLKIAQEGLEIAEIRFNGVKQSFLNGDKPAVDTLESFITNQNRRQSLILTEQEFINSQFNLNNFLWVDGYIPLEIENSTIPENFEVTLYKNRVDSLALIKEDVVAMHPEILLYDFKLESLAIEQRLNKDALKPDLRVSYNPLFGSTEEQLFGPPDINDYKAGAALVYPLFLRSERAKIKLTDLKIENANIEVAVKRQNLLVKLSQMANDTRRLEDRLNILNEVISNYNRLLEAENLKFQLGESSIFLINTREQSFLEASQKRVEDQYKLIQKRLSFLLYTGMLWE